jgi:hypothetical protein
MVVVGMPRKNAKHGQIQPKSRALYTPEPVRGRVIARHIGGESNRRIATAEGIDRETVSRILSQQEVAELTAQHRSRLLLMVPKAIAVYEEALASDDLRIAAATATKLLEGLQVFPKGCAEPPQPQPNHNEKRLLMLGQIMEMMLYKGQKYRVPLPLDFDGLENEVTKRLEGPAA